MNHIPSNHSLLEAARFELGIAVSCAKEYEKTWHSIIWIQSKRFLKAFLASACGWRSQEGGRNSAIAQKKRWAILWARVVSVAA
ncbi:hypothetical protein [Nostoc sp. 'Peltigera membranacea cyanobiont' 232]|uniref:hypothetical protein n=1 Tax=Nostoc sp. 'Peltigera membranacea cyanobiont' 232 TaxID=2014531 RepID=UPI0011809A74|nr:hypothetical protein [Nostoc sp. 'Peltigera membranacea cyanobiont' 232]